MRSIWAKTQRCGRKVALKLLPAAFTSDRERLRRFEQEARAVSALNHPNIITIHEIGQVNGAHYLVTEYVEGETLRQRIEREPLTLSRRAGYCGAGGERIGCGPRRWDRAPRHQAGEYHGAARRLG